MRQRGTVIGVVKRSILLLIHGFIFLKKHKIYSYKGEYCYDDGKVFNHDEFELCDDCAKSFMRWLKDEE